MERPGRLMASGFSLLVPGDRAPVRIRAERQSSWSGMRMDLLQIRPHVTVGAGSTVSLRLVSPCLMWELTSAGQEAGVGCEG